MRRTHHRDLVPWRARKRHLQRHVDVERVTTGGAASASAAAAIVAPTPAASGAAATAAPTAAPAGAASPAWRPVATNATEYTNSNVSFTPT